MKLFDQLQRNAQLIVTSNVKIFHLFLCVKLMRIKQEKYALCAPSAFHNNSGTTRKLVIFGNVTL